MILRLALTAALLAACLMPMPVSAQSGCYYNGVLYPAQTRVGGLVCVDGQWVPG